MGEHPAPGHERPDLRALALGAAAWTGGLLGLTAGGAVVAGCALASLAGLLWLWWRGYRPQARLAAAWVLAAAAVCCSAGLRAEATATTPVAHLADSAAFVTATAHLDTDPRLRQGKREPYVLVRATVTEVTGRGSRYRTRAPVLVIAGEDWQDAALGSLVSVEGRLGPAEGRDLAAVLTTSRPPTVVSEQGSLLAASGVVRAGIRRAVAPLSEAERSLIPALVVGDDVGMPEDVVEDFQVAGLTHLLAVSGTNLTLVVGFLLIVARWVGVRGRGLLLVGLLGVVGFVLLARTEPSVVRAAAMGSVALLGMSSNGRRKGVRGLGVAVLCLLLLDPWMAVSTGFALSALATAGILLLAPPWRDALVSWLPRWAAEALAVPLAAQLAVTPVVAAVSDQVSLVAVAANVVVAAAVAPATVCGLVGGLLMLVVEPLGLLCGRVAGGCAWWVVTVAGHAASLPTAAVDWPSTPLSLVALSAACLVLAQVTPYLLARRTPTVAAAALLAIVMVRPLPEPGWPPPGWVMVACDVGQGDALVLNAGSGRAVLVDAGPDPRALDRCLDRLAVGSVARVFLSHFHADHVDGLPGAADGRRVGAVEVSFLPEPMFGAEAVARWADTARVPVRVPGLGETGRVGAVSWQVLWPASERATGLGEGGSVANNASLVLLAEVEGVRLLLTGDVEPEAQRLLAEIAPGLRADVLKVPHHGSRYQDPAFLSGLGARLAVVSVGEGNEYGHPAETTLDLLGSAGMVVRRTDESGDVAVAVQGGRLVTRTTR